MNQNFIQINPLTQIIYGLLGVVEDECYVTDGSSVMVMRLYVHAMYACSV
jgi:hypothetical protein